MTVVSDIKVRPYADAPRLPEGEALDPRALVPGGAGLVELEIGPGRGGFLFERLAVDPGIRMVGLEIRRKWATIVDRRLAERGVGERGRVFAQDARHALPRFVAGCFSHVHLHFPDPWWKKRHQKRLVLGQSIVPELLRLIPGIDVSEAGYTAPGYMCASFAALPKAMDDINNNTVRAAKAARADAVVPMFHQCYRELVGLDAAGAVPVYNYIQLIARSMGLPYADDYKEWKRAGRIGADAIAKVGIEFYERAMLPELKKRPNLR